jgi:predicted nucleic acid-binding protein
MSAYLDTSVLVALFADDVHSERAQSFLDVAPSPLIISDFGAAEFASVVARFVRMRQMERNVALKLFTDFDTWTAHAVQRIEAGAADIAAASVMLRRLDLTLRTQDAIHIAVAQRAGADLATFDARQAAAAGALGLAVALA